jgi:hypothetical protein
MCKISELIRKLMYANIIFYPKMIYVQIYRCYNRHVAFHKTYQCTKMCDISFTLKVRDLSPFDNNILLTHGPHPLRECLGS